MLQQSSTRLIPLKTMITKKALLKIEVIFSKQIGQAEDEVFLWNELQFIRYTFTKQHPDSRNRKEREKTAQGLIGCKQEDADELEG